MSPASRREKFRSLLSGDSVIYPASVFDAISARIAEDIGFEAGMLAGSVASLAILGSPDLATITLSELADLARRIARGSALPFLVDADHGYGNALNVRRTVEELETAGVAALTIEDTLLPAAYGAASRSLITIDEATDKMRAALDARTDPALVIAGRTSVPPTADIDDLVERCRAYSATGVDAIFIAGSLKERRQLERVAEVVRVPMILGGVGDALKDKTFLAQLNVRMVLQGHRPIADAVAAVYRSLMEIREGVAASKLGKLSQSDLMDHVTRKRAYDAWQNEFLGHR